MTRKIIRIGTSANDGTGDTLRETASKINYNFTELYSVLGIEGCGADISIRLQPSCNSDLILSTCGTGKVIIGDPINPVIVIPGPTDPTDVVIKPPTSTKKIVIGDATCGGVVTVPGCSTGDPISIGNPVGPRITVPPVGSPNPITIGNPSGPKIEVPPVGSPNPITIGDPTGPKVVVPPKNSPDPVVIGNPTGPVVVGNPTGPSVTVPPPGSTNPITIGNPTGPSVTVPPPGSTNPVVIGNPTGPRITIPPVGSPNPITIGDPADPKPIKLGNMDPYRLVWTDSTGAVTVGTHLRVQEAKDEIHSIAGYGEVGRNKQFEGSNIIIEPHVDTPDPLHPNTAVRGIAGLYFNRPVTNPYFAEAQNLKALNPTRRAGYIKYWSNDGGTEYVGQLELSPWYQGASSFNTNLIDYDYIANDDRALFISRYRDFYTWGPVLPSGHLGTPNQQTALRTTQYLFNGGGGHQAVSIGGSMDFASYNAEGAMYKSDVPQYSAGANMGYSYINIPALHTGAGPKWIGQFSSNPKKIRVVTEGTSYQNSDGIPFWSLGYKMSTQNIENYPSIGIAQYERIPDNHAISWDVRGRVSINEATLDESLNILGSLKIQVASTVNNPNGVVSANYRAGRKQTGEENQVGIYFADGSFQYTAWLGTGLNKSINILGTTNEVEVTGPTNGVFTVGLPDDVTITRNLTVGGDLTVNGTTTTINSTTLTVDDKNIELGSVATPTETTANGGGITLKGGTDKTIIWQQSTDRWVFNRGIDVVDAVVNNLTSHKFVKTDANKKLITADITWADIGSPACEVPITIGHACNPGNGIKIPGGSDTTSPVEVGNGGNPVKIGGGGDSGGTGITVPKNGSGDPIRLGSPIRFTDGTTQSTAAKTYSQSAETATGGAFLRLKGTATGAADTNDDVKIASGTDITVTRTDADTITVNATNQRLSIVNDAAGDVTYNMMMTTASSGTISTANVDNADLTYNPSTGTLTTPNLLVSQSGVDFTGAVNALYYGSAANRVTLANYNSGGKITFEVNGGAYTAHFNADGTYQFANLYTTAVGASPKPLAVGSDGIIGYGEAGDSLYDAGTHSTGATLYLNRNNGTIQKVRLASNVTDIVISNIAVARSFTIIFTQDGTGSRTLATNSAFKYASGYKTLSTGANTIDMLNIFYDGTTYYCTLTTGYA
jgi:hypothetical protein